MGDEVEVPHREVGLILARCVIPAREKIERSADASRGRHAPCKTLRNVIRQTGPGNRPTNRIELARRQVLSLLARFDLEGLLCHNTLH